MRIEAQNPHQLAQSSAADFLSCFAELYEHSPWVVERALPQVQADSLYADLVQFHVLVSDIVLQAEVDLQDKLIKAHPLLAGKKAQRDELTDFSTNEQKSAGLNACSNAEIAHFEQLNQRYLEQFGFPFIMAVKGKSKQEIFNSFEQRLQNNHNDERQNALTQINRIALLRIKEIYSYDE